MSCDQSQALIHAYLDGELDLLRTMEIEDHLRECPACAGEYANSAALSSAIKRDTSLYYPMPVGLRGHVHALLAETVPKGEAGHLLGWPSRWGQFGAMAAALILVAVLTWTISLNLSGFRAQDLLAREIVSEHVRSLMANHLTDVPSSDQHTVKPWFRGKLDFSPRVTDLSKQGFVLIGGRLDYIQDKSVAALVYQRRQHVVNLFSWPSAAESDEAAQKVTRKGYNLIHWRQSGMFYCAISDLNDRELLDFVRLVQK